MAEQPGSGRLDPEILAAYVDGRLPPEDRARVEAEIAADPETQEWLVNTIRAVEEVDSVPEPRLQIPAVVLPFYRRRRVLGGVGVVLATAAALLLVVRVQPAWWQQLWGPAVDPRFAKLVAAVGEERYVEGRLSGGFKYGPLRSVTRGPGDLSNQNLALLAAAGELQKAAQEDPSAENLHAWGVAQLLLRDYEGAVTTLEDAALERTPDWSLQSDLAAALLARASDSSRSDDVPRALEQALSAIEGGAIRAEPYFTAAVALERLHLGDQAARMWQRYLEHDAISPWAEEARRRLMALQRPSPTTEWREIEKALQAHPAAADAVRRAGSDFLHEVPELLIHTLAARQKGDPLAVETARDLARILADSTGDTGILAAIETITSAEPGARPGTVLATVRLSEGMAVFGDDRYADAEQPLREARAGLTREPVLHAWASYALGRVEFAQGHLPEALLLLEEARESADALGHKSLAARARWTLGIVRFSRGEWNRARTDYADALSRFEAQHDQRGAAIVQMNIAILHRFFGDTADSWRYRLAALERPPAHRPARWHGFLVTLAVSASLDGFNRVAAAVADAAVANADAFLGSHMQAEARQQRARILAVLRRDAEAARDVREARDRWELIADPALKQRMALSLEATIAQVEHRSNPAKAVEAARRAIIMAGERGDMLRSAEIAIYLARSLVSEGNRSAARVAIRRGLADFERARASMPADDPVRLSAFQPVWQLFDEAVELELSEGKIDEERLFDAIEVRRARTLLELSERRHSTLMDVKRGLPRETTLLVLDQRERELLAWVVSRADSTLHRLSITKDESRRLVASYRGALQRGRPDPGAGAQFYNMVTGILPAGDHGTLVIVQDDVYRGLPWSTLRSTTGELLIHRWAIAVSPSASLAVGETPTEMAATPTSVFVIGDPTLDPAKFPPLPGARRELNAVAALYDRSVVRTGVDATPSAALSDGGAMEVVHVSTHAVESLAYPMLSRLILAPDQSGRSELSVEDILRSAPFRPGATVVLATCSSIGTGSRRGEGSIGLAWGHLAVGARAVVGTLWEIDDRLATDLFVRLHRGLRRGLTPAEAVREAQRRAEADGIPSVEWGAIQVHMQSRLLVAQREEGT